MARKYDKELVAKLKERQTTENYMGAEMIVKNLPDCDIPGAMDPRLYNDMGKQIKLLAFMPKGMLKMDTSPKGLAKLRVMFNEVKSTPCVEAKINIEKRTVAAADGYQIPIRIYHSETPVENSPILYYIHGGGFFGGSPDVVEESVKMFVEKTNMVAVSVDYRLMPENPYPLGHEDCYSVLKWTYENAASIGGDAKNIFVAGDSAGGNLTQYCTTKSWEDGKPEMVKGQMLLYPTLNMAEVKDEFFNPDISTIEMAPKQKRGMTKFISMFQSMVGGLDNILNGADIKDIHLSPYTRDASQNPATFLTVGEHDFLRFETLGYGAKLHKAGVDITMIMYKGFGHAYFDNCGVYPQTEDLVDEMAKFILEHASK